MNITKSLKRIYRAKDCTDLQDTILSISDLRTIIFHAKACEKLTYALYRRLISFEKRHEYFLKKKFKI